MIIDNINKLPTKKKAVIAFCFPCLLKVFWKDKLLSKVSILALTLIYFIFLIQNIYYELYDTFDSKNMVFVIFLFINLFTYILMEALKINTKKAYLEVFVILCIVLLFANFHYSSQIFSCVKYDNVCDYTFNQNYEIIIMIGSLFLFLFTLFKIIMKTSEKTKKCQK